MVRRLWNLDTLTAAAEDEHRDAERDDAEREEMRDRQWSEHARVDADEFEREAESAGEDEITAEHHTIADAPAAPSNQQPRQDAEERGLVQLGRMHGVRRRWEAARKRDAPGQRRRAPVVVADERAADPPDQLTDRERRRRGGEHGDHGPSSQDDRPETDEEPAGEP